LAVVRLMQVGAVLTMAALGTFWFVMFRREHHPSLSAKDSNR
jgi:hypothetical protein